jgi:hypothetical protein
MIWTLLLTFTNLKLALKLGIFSIFSLPHCRPEDYFFTALLPEKESFDFSEFNKPK